jgi:hypothetical protein
MPMNDQSPQIYDQTEGRGSARAVWTTPAIKRLATSEAEFNPAGPNTDTEGFTS